MSEHHALIIFNPVSGKGESAKRLQELERLATAAGWTGRIALTSAHERAGKLVAQGIREGFRHIVVCGGDGTVMEALPAIVGTGVVLGIVPTGTGNLLALNLDIPLRLSAALRIALTGKPSEIAIGKANGRLFSIAAGIGFDAAMLRDATPQLKKRYGLLAYTVATIRNLAHHPRQYRITLDGAPPKTYVAKGVIVAKVGRLQGNIRAVPGADPEKPTLKVVVIRPETLSAWVGLLLHALVGRVDRHRSYTLLEGQNVKIRSLNGAELVECDGDVLPASHHLNAEIVAERVVVMRPN